MKFSRKKLMKEIMREAKVLNLHMGAAEIMAGRVAANLAKKMEGREFTQHELDQKVARELKKYNPDLAYIYQHRGRII